MHIDPLRSAWQEQGYFFLRGLIPAERAAAVTTEIVDAIRRAAMVYHYAEAGSRALSPQIDAVLSRVNRWLPVSRAQRGMS